MNIGTLNARCRIEYPEHSQDLTYGGDVITWKLLDVVWCNYQDELPSKSNVVKSGLALGTNPMRIRMRYRSDIDSSMRVTINRPDATYYRIVGGPAELGDKDGIEIMVESFSTLGG